MESALSGMAKSAEQFESRINVSTLHDTEAEVATLFGNRLILQEIDYPYAQALVHHQRENIMAVKEETHGASVRTFEQHLRERNIAVFRVKFGRLTLAGIMALNGWTVLLKKSSRL